MAIGTVATGGADAAKVLSPVRKLAYTSPLAWIRFLIVAFGGVALDLSTKRWAFGHLGYGQGSRVMIVIPNVLTLRTTLNGGAVFGLGQGLSLLFILISLVAIAFVLYVFMSSFREHWVIHLALGLIFAGAMGNLYDRAFNHGHVRDFILLAYWPWIFNFADAMLCVGVPVLVFTWIFQQSSIPQRG